MCSSKTITENQSVVVCVCLVPQRGLRVMQLHLAFACTWLQQTVYIISGEENMCQLLDFLSLCAASVSFNYSCHRVCFIGRGLQQDLLSILENVKGTTKVGHLHIQSGSICLKCHNTPLLLD